MFYQADGFYAVQQSKFVFVFVWIFLSLRHLNCAGTCNPVKTGKIYSELQPHPTKLYLIKLKIVEFESNIRIEHKDSKELP